MNVIYVNPIEPLCLTRNRMKRLNLGLSFNYKRLHQTSGTGLPVSDVLYYELENGRLILRPSGTEPKLKAYVSYYSKEQAEAEAKLAQLADIALSTMKELTK